MGPTAESSLDQSPLVSVRGLGRRYGEQWAVRGVDFDVAPGRILGIIGPNGAGKSTTLKMLAGLLDPTEGTAHLEGSPTRDPEHRARVGYLPEESPLYEDMTPVGYLEFFARLYGVPKTTATERIEALLTRLQLEVRTEKRIGDLSKGMRRKVAIARSLVHDPDLLIYDEPASGLDPLISAGVLEMVQDLRADGKAILLSAHNLYHVERICDEVLLLHRGQVVAQGPMKEVREQLGGTAYVVTLNVPVEGSKAGEAGFEVVIEDLSAVEDLETEAKAQGGRVLDVRAQDLSLEELFLRTART